MSLQNEKKVCENISNRPCAVYCLLLNSARFFFSFPPFFSLSLQMINGAVKVDCQQLSVCLKSIQHENSGEAQLFT